MSKSNASVSARSLGQGFAGRALPAQTVAIAPNLLVRFGEERDRASQVLQALRAIDEALYGTGKAMMSGELKKSPPPPESADKILAELAQIVEESLGVADRIYQRL